MEGWTSGNPNIDRFIKDTMYNARDKDIPFLEWVPFDRFTDIKQIGEGGFAKVFLQHGYMVNHIIMLDQLKLL